MTPDLPSIPPPIQEGRRNGKFSRVAVIAANTPSKWYLAATYKNRTSAYPFMRQARRGEGPFENKGTFEALCGRINTDENPQYIDRPYGFWLRCVRPAVVRVPDCADAEVAND